MELNLYVYYNLLIMKAVINRVLTYLQIVLGDRSEQKAFKYTGTTCFNPGSFSNDSTFVVYRPCNQEVELSAVES